MGIQRTAVSVLLALVSSTEAMPASDPLVCYLLDGILLLYCIIATAFFVREKIFLPSPPEAQSPTDADYEDVDMATRTGARPKRRQEAGGDTYQTLQAAGRSTDTYEALGRQASAPLPPQ